MKILVVADIHGEYKKLPPILKNAPKNIDAVVCPGDMTDMFSLPAHFSQTDIAGLVIQNLLLMKTPLLCVPGNQDPYDILGLFDEYGVNLHNRVRKVGGVVFAGWGGARTPFNTIFEPTEEETAAALNNIGKKIESPFVLVVHSPPKGTALDKIASGEHVGSSAIREFVLKKKPLLVISAHIHENKGTDMVGKTTIFYPGPAYEGWYGTVEIKNNKVVCEFKQTKLKRP